MLKRIIVTLALAIFLLGLADHASAITISLSSSPGDLSSLGIGDMVTVDVILSDLDTAGGEELEFLAVTVVIDDLVFGTPTSITPSEIVPDPDGFLGVDGPGFAEGSFDAFFTLSGTDRITTNGTFFSFELEAIGAGSGSIAIEFADALFPDFSSPSINTSASPPLDFTVNPGAAPTAVPEPVTSALALVGLAGLGANIYRRRTC